LTADYVRKKCYTHIEILDAEEASAFSRDISSKKFEAFPGSELPDVRLVIDILASDGSTRTYIASKFRIYAPNGESSAEIDAKFRSKFRFGRTGFDGES
jgi:hypothetical protein